ncbi:MAG TPA: DAK2 domain-containing protein [Acidimicrobiales bacterium]|nr:DAK2 domain-containing protein [Acidimicrobiales bacterium]
MEPMGTVGAADVAAAVTTFRDVLRLHQDAINRLNVYPVPDGDTGTNMALTMEAVVAELPGADGGGSAEMAAVCKAIAHGSLMGARGNSGVILSQLLRGLTGVLVEHQELGGPSLAAALTAAGEAAYQAVLRPVEGTILTVARVAAEGGQRAAADGGGIVAVLDAARLAGGDALAKTPEQLPVLAQAGVVDAGGTGYLLLLDAFLAVTDGRSLPEPPVVPSTALAVAAAALPQLGSYGAAGTSAILRYEVMYLLEALDDTIPAFKDVWAGLGDSIVVVGGEGLWNCHIHTNDVGPAIEAALDAGRPRNIRVTDLSDQVEEERWVREGVSAPEAERRAGPPPRTTVVAVATGEGIGRIFHSLGVHHIVPGGQSMNPSTAQILEMVEASPSPEVVLLPNNDNIHPVANQVCELASKPVRVVPTSGVVEGFAALLEYDPEAGAEENARTMAESARRVVAGEVAQAVRDATGPAGPIAEGDWMGISRDGVEVVCSTLVEATCSLLGKLLRDEHELVTLIEGEGAGAAETRQVTEWIAEHRPDLAVEVHHGGQPFYPYLLSIE